MSDQHPAERIQDADGLPAGYGAEMLDYIRELPGGKELFEASERHGGCVELVGGAVRDILLGGTPRELDVVVQDRVQDLARELARSMDGELTLHERFGTAVVSSERADIDLATMRAETYSAPGALPEVTPGTPEQDLAPARLHRWLLISARTHRRVCGPDQGQWTAQSRISGLVVSRCSTTTASATIPPGSCAWPAMRYAWRSSAFASTITRPHLPRRHCEKAPCTRFRASGWAPSCAWP